MPHVTDRYCPTLTRASGGEARANTFYPFVPSRCRCRGRRICWASGSRPWAPNQTFACYRSPMPLPVRCGHHLPASGDRGRLPPASGDRDRRPPASGDPDRRLPASEDRERRLPASGDQNRRPPASGDRCRRLLASGDRGEVGPPPETRTRPGE